MEMFLVALFTCVFGLAVCVIGFGIASRSDEEEQPQPSDGVSIPPAQFFLDDIPSAPSPSRSRVPPGLLMLQLERHIRLEQAAAEAFLDLPTVEILHARTASPLMN